MISKHTEPTALLILSPKKEGLQPAAHRKTSSQKDGEERAREGSGVSRARRMVSMKPRGAVLCGRPCQAGGSVCLGLYGAGHGLRPAVWPAQFLDFSFGLPWFSL